MRSGTGTERPETADRRHLDCFSQLGDQRHELIVPARGEIWPATRFVPNETIFCEPIRHGTHLPHDSLRKNSSEFSACSAMSRPFRVDDQPGAERLRRAQRAEEIQLQLEVEDVDLGRVRIDASPARERLPRLVVHVVARQAPRRP